MCIAATTTVLLQCVIVMYLSLYLMLLVVKATTMLHINITVCNAAAILLLSLCVNVVCVFVIVPYSSI